MILKKTTLMLGVVIIGICLLITKFFAWYKTGSNAILADALESVVNVTAGTFTAFSVYLASKPGDKEHPYGHGKAEFFAAGFEGSLIFLAGLLAIGRSTWSFFHPYELENLDAGTILSGVSMLVNGGMGIYLLQKGKRENSIALESNGKHLISDGLTSIGLIAGLILIFYTGWNWADNVLSVVFGVVILQSGFLLVRRSVSGLMDEADFRLLEDIIQTANRNREENWVDIHNLRMQKFGERIHIDLHLTLPWYQTLDEAHEDVKRFEKVMESGFPGRIEAFIHSDPCVPVDSCTICAKSDCTKRESPLKKKLEWNLENSLRNSKHQA